MKFTVKEKCTAIAALYKCEKMVKTIHTTLKLLQINELFIFCSRECHKKIDNINDRLWEGRLCSLHLPNIVNAIYA